ncbi:MAG: DUF4339 domain-containing protein [Pirellulales bacterium]
MACQADYPKARVPSQAARLERTFMEGREPAVPSPVWFTKVMGEELGPMSLADLTAMARNRHLLPADVVKQGKAGQWIAARTVKGLFQDDRVVHGGADSLLHKIDREATRLESRARWMTISPYRDEQGKIRVKVALVGLEADPSNLAGSIVSELRRRLDELEEKLDGAKEER